MWLTYYICKNTHRNLSKMRWQRNMFQTKEQDKTPEEQLSEVTIGSLPERGFWVMTVKMIHKLRKRMNAQSKQLQGVLNTELENINSYQTELKNPITEMKWHVLCGAGLQEACAGCQQHGMETHLHLQSLQQSIILNPQLRLIGLGCQGHHFCSKY